MKTSVKILFVFFLLSFLAFISACKKTPDIGQTFFNIKEIAGNNPVIASFTGGDGFKKPVLKVTPTTKNAIVTIWETGDNGNWADITFARENNMPYVLPLSRFPTTRVQLYRDFPDVFSDEYLRNSEEFAKQLADYKDDPYLVGYFLRNEPHWAFGYHNLAYEMFGTSQVGPYKDDIIKIPSIHY